MKPRRIVTLGNAFLDTIVYLPRLPSEPSKIRANDVLKTGGGIAATAAYTVAQLGGQTSYWGRLGQDDVGDQIIDRLQHAGVDTRHVQRVLNGRSPIGTILVSPCGERMAFGFIGRNLGDNSDWLPLAELDSADGVMVDYSWAAGATALLCAARDRGVVSVLDADVGDLSAVQALLALPDHVVFSADCLTALTECEDTGDALRRADAMCAGKVSVTCGAEGFFWLEDDQIRHIPAFVVQAIDTNGAGDIFHGAFTLGLAEGRSVEQAARLASATAALKCARGSGWESIPDRRTVDALLNGETI